MLKIQQVTIEDALQSLRSAPEGLSEPEAARRLGQFGTNQVARQRSESLIHTFLKEFTHFFAILLWIAAALAFRADHEDPGQGMATLGWAIVGVIVVNSVFSFWQVHRAESTLAALEKLLPQRVRVRRSGIFCDRLAANLVPGDLIALEAGDLVPADCRLIETFDVRVINATVTGESIPLVRNADPCATDDVIHATNIILAGTTVVSGDARAVVFATGIHTEFGKIAHLTQTAHTGTLPLEREIAFVCKVVAVLSATVGSVFFVVGRFLGLSFWSNLLFAVGVIVANVPEGLLPVVTLALAMGAQRLARRNVLVRAPLRRGDTRIGDSHLYRQDGTLTENRMAARRLFLEGRLHDVAAPEQLAELGRAHRAFFEGAWLCHNLKAAASSDGDFLGDPTEIALVRLARPVIPTTLAYPRRDEVPFDSERKRLSTLHETPSGLILYTKGALETVLPLCEHLQVGPDVVPLTSDGRTQLLRAQDEMANAGLRVLALAYRTVAVNEERAHLEHGLTLTGLVGLEDPPRPEVPAAIEDCRMAGIRVIMITGDHPQTALAIGRQIGLVQTEHPVVMTGEHLRQLSDSQLQLLLDAPEVLFARAAPEQKMRIVQLLMRGGAIVAVTGDGVNDAPALKQADIGIAMGVCGTDVARQAADMVLADDNFASIVAGVKEGRAIFANIRKFLTYVLTSNVPELVPYLAFVLLRVPLALTVIQMLAVDLGTNVLPALALGAEKAEPDVMRRPPRSRTERLLRWPILWRVYGILGVFESAAAMTAFFSVLLTGGWRYGQALPSNAPLYLLATSAYLSTVVMMQVLNVFVCRSDRVSTLSYRPAKNRLILTGIAVELCLLLLVVYSPWGHTVFGTASLSWRTWCIVLPFALTMLFVEELRKWMLRRLGARSLFTDRPPSESAHSSELKPLPAAGRSTVTP